MVHLKAKDKVRFEPHPDDLKALACRLYPAIKAYYESEKGQREFEEWKKQKVKIKTENKS